MCRCRVCHKVVYYLSQTGMSTDAAKSVAQQAPHLLSEAGICALEASSHHQHGLDGSHAWDTAAISPWEGGGSPGVESK